MTSISSGRRNDAAGAWSLQTSHSRPSEIQRVIGELRLAGLDKNSELLQHAIIGAFGGWKNAKSAKAIATWADRAAPLMNIAPPEIFFTIKQ